MRGAVALSLLIAGILIVAAGLNIRVNEQALRRTAATTAARCWTLETARQPALGTLFLVEMDRIERTPVAGCPSVLIFCLVEIKRP